MRSLTRVVGAWVLAVSVTATGLAFGDDTKTQLVRQAESAFAQGLAAMKKNQFKEACDAFAASDQADPSPGTEINLALCNEKQGKLASAWGWYRTASGLADTRGQKDRAETARGEALKLEPRLHKIVISTKVQSEGLVVTGNGTPVPAVLLGNEQPVDPGDYTVEATARNKKPWKLTVHVAPTPGVDRVEIPALEDAPVEPKPGVVGVPAGGGDYVAPEGSHPSNFRRNAGFVAGGVGIALGVVAVALEILAGHEDDKSKEQSAAAANIKPIAPAVRLTPAQTSDQNSALSSATDHHNAAKSDQTIAIVTGIGALALIGTGVVLIVTAPSSSTGKSSGSLSRPLVVPMIGRDNAGVGLVGRF